MIRRAAILLIVAAGGCASSNRAVVEWTANGPVWPPPPEQPRVRYLGQIAGDLPPAEPKGLLSRVLFGPEPKSRLVTPMAVAVHAAGQRVAIADPNAGGVHLIDVLNSTYDFRPHRNDPPELFTTPTALTWLHDTLFVADAAGHVAALAADGRSQTFGREHLLRPAGIAANPAQGAIYIVDAGKHSVLVYEPSGRLLQTIGSRGFASGEFNFPTHIALGPTGELTVSDSLNFRVQRLTANGLPLHNFGRKGDAAGDFALPKGVAVDANGNIWVVDAQFENVQAFSPDGQLLMAFGGEGARPGEFWLPAGLTIDAQNRMWIADTYNRRVQIFEILQ